PPLAYPCRGLSPLRLPVPVARLDAFVEKPAELAAVVGPEGRRVVGNLCRRDEVTPADLGGIDPDLARRRLDQPLSEIGRLRPPGAAIGPVLRRVGEQARGRHEDILHII